MSIKSREYSDEEMELDVTPFMNLMIVLVPVMLLSLTFTQITVHEIKLPDLSQSEVSSQETPPKLEVLIADDGIKVFYPSDILVQEIPMRDAGADKAYDFDRLSLVLQEIKKNMIDKRDVLVLSEGTVDYQSLVSLMDTVKSYKTVLAASLVEVELFPEVSLADASVK